MGGGAHEASGEAEAGYGDAQRHAANVTVAYGAIVLGRACPMCKWEVTEDHEEPNVSNAYAAKGGE